MRAKHLVPVERGLEFLELAMPLIMLSLHRLISIFKVQCTVGTVVMASSSLCMQTRDYGWWILEICIVGARASDYTASDLADITRMCQLSELSALGDKGLSDNDRIFITPFKAETVRLVLMNTPRDDRERVLSHFEQFNSDIGAERYVPVISYSRFLLFSFNGGFN